MNDALFTAGIVAIVIGAAGLIWAVWAQRREIDRLHDRANTSAGDAWRYQLALAGIAGMATPGANATVKRMSKAARDALGGEA